MSRADAPRRYQLACDLMISALSAPELRRLVLYVGGEEALTALPGESASLAELGVQAVLTLHRHNLLDEALLSLETQRPARADEIRSVRAAFASCQPAPGILEAFDACLELERPEGIADLLAERPPLVAKLLTGSDHGGFVLYVDGAAARARSTLAFMATQFTVRSSDWTFLAFEDITAPLLDADRTWTPRLADAIEFMKNSLINPKVTAQNVARGIILAGRRHLLTPAQRHGLQAARVTLTNDHLDIRTYDWLRDRLATS